MTPKIRHKQLSKVTKKYKNLAGIVAAATILSTAILPGMPTTIAHASANPNSSNMSATTSQQAGKTNDSGLQINFNESVVTPTKESNAPQPISNANKISETTYKATEQTNPNVQPDPNHNKTPVTTSKPTQQANPNIQPDPNSNKTPVTTSKPTEQANPNVQPDPNIGNAPVITPTPTEQASPNVQPASTAATTSSDNAPTNYKQVLDIKATAYAPGPHDNDQWGNKTFIGSQVRPGIIAVDPNVIPLGSRVYIEYPDGHGEYAIAEDTGGAIKGNRVDIAKWTVNEAQDFGIQNVKVYVVNTPEKV